MSPDAASLPDDVDLLKAMLVAAGAELEHVRMQVARLRMAFGRSSEKLTREADQLELGLEESEAHAAATATPAVTRARDAAKPYRQPLPDQLPREDVVHDGPRLCPDCSGAMRRMGEDVTEQLDYVPASFRVVRHVRPQLSCRSCERVVQAPLPSMPIERGRPGAGLLAHCWCPSTPTTFRSTASRASTRARGWTLLCARQQTGSACAGCPASCVGFAPERTGQKIVRQR